MRFWEREHVRISLVMPNYNHAGYLRASIGGMLAQTRPADEIIIIDDASDDDSVAEIERLTRGAANVRIVRNQVRQGTVNALNDGLALASGDLIAFLGADDQVQPGFLATLAPLMERYPEAAIGCARVEILDNAGAKAGKRPIIRPRASAGHVSPDALRRQLRHADNFFLGQVTLYRSARLRELGAFDKSLGSLSDGMVLRRMAVRWGYVFTPAVLGIWRVHGRNFSVTSVADPKRVEEMISDGRRQILSESPGLFPSDYADRFERRMRFNCARLLLSQVSEAGGGSAILEIMRGTWLDAAAFAVISRLGPLAHRLALCWLTLRLRPFAATWLGSEAVLRLADALRDVVAPRVGGASLPVGVRQAVD